MSGISASSAIATARHALMDAIRMALVDETEVDITFGFRWPEVHPDWFALTDLETDAQPKMVTPRRQLDETITFHASVGAWREGHDDTTEVAVFDRAFALLTKVQDHIRTKDVTLGGTVLWCVPGSTTSDAATTGENAGMGRLVEIDATFICAHRVRGL